MLLIIRGKDINSDTSISAGAVVVGSGAGGATAAYLLSEAGIDVVMVEEGGYYTSENFTGRVSDMMGMLYRDSGMTPIFGKPNIPFAEGCCVGGSTVINGGLCWRTPEEILNRWSYSYKLPMLDEDYMSEIFVRIEKDLNISVQSNESANMASKKLEEGCRRLKWRYEPVSRAQVGCENSNRCPSGCPTGAKQSMLVTYIPKMLDNGSRLYSNARVEKILIRGSKAVGVEAVVRNGRRKSKLRVNAERVFLGCGSMQTPYLLKRNGFNRNIGKNLQIHLNIKVVALFDEDINPHIGTMMTSQVKEFEKENIFIGSSNFDPVYLALTLAPHANKVIERLCNNWKKVAIYLAQIKCSGVGRIFTNRFVNRPLPIYNLTREDEARVGTALEKLAEVVFASGAKELYLPISKSPVIRSVRNIKDFLSGLTGFKNADFLSVHAMSTCAMGADNSSSAVNPFGLLHGTKNVFISDASILPESTGVNPQLTIMALVHRNMIEILNSGGH